MIHIIPTDDLKEHEESTHCHCRPTVDWENEIVIHNAFDNREAIEIAREILNTKLKPCPLCGQTLITMDSDYSEELKEYMYWITCASCQLTLRGLTKREVVTGWNNRINP